MKIIAEKNIPRFELRLLINIAYWSIYQSLMLFLLYYYGKDLGILLSTGYLIYGFIFLFKEQIRVLVNVKINESSIIFKILKFNHYVEHKFDLRSLEVNDKSHWIGKDVLFKTKEFNLRLVNDYFWRSREINELLKKIHDYKAILKESD